MINILLKDKNGVEVSNGDILKIVSIKKEFQEEFDPYFKFNVGVNIDWEEITINPQQDLDNLGYCGIDNYEYFTKETLLEIFDLPPNCIYFKIQSISFSAKSEILKLFLEAPFCPQSTISANCKVTLSSISYEDRSSKKGITLS